MAFIKRPGQVRGFFKVFACMSQICQGWRDTLTSCQVAVPLLDEEEGEARVGKKSRGSVCHMIKLCAVVHVQLWDRAPLESLAGRMSLFFRSLKKCGSLLIILVAGIWNDLKSCSANLFFWVVKSGCSVSHKVFF